MWSRAEVKKRAWNGLKKYYFQSVLAGVLTALMQLLSVALLVLFVVLSVTVSGLLSTICCVGCLASVGIGIVDFFALEIINGLYTDILTIGKYKFILKNIREQQKIPVGTIFSGFSSGHYKNTAKIMIFRNIYQFLWSLLFCIPGIVKAYEYRMIPYILADYPDKDQDEVFRMSKQMMDGNKMASFIMDLTFVGWYLLGSIGIGIGIFFVQPYYYAAVAEQYMALAEERLGIPGINRIEAKGAVLTGIEGEFTGAKIPIGIGDKLVIGRDPARCSVVIQSPQVSGLHLTVEYDGNVFFVTDYSTNGTYDLEQGRLPKDKRVRVTPGTYIQLGTGGDIFRLEVM